MTFGAAIVPFLLVRVSVPDSFVQRVFVDRAVGMDRALVLGIDLRMAYLAGGILQSRYWKDEQHGGD